MPRPKSPKTLARIERNAKLFSQARFGCPACMQSRSVKIDRRGKPYISCLPCGAQLFVRKDSGVRRFLDRVQNGAPGASTTTPSRSTNPLLRRAHNG